MAIDSIGSGSGSLSDIRDSIISLRGLDSVNRVDPAGGDRSRPADDVRISSASVTDPRAVQRQEIDALRQGLSDASATGNVALAGAQAVSGTLDQVGARLQQLTDQALSAEQRAGLSAEIQGLIGQGLDTVNQSSFNGVNLLDADRREDLRVATDRDGGTETLRDQDIRTALEGLQGLDLSTAASARAAIDGVFADARTAADTAVGNLTEDTGRITDRLAEVRDQQAASTTAGEESVNDGLNADTARQVAQQAEQALSGQTLSLVNQRPESLVGLFR